MMREDEMANLHEANRCIRRLVGILLIQRLILINVVPAVQNLNDEWERGGGIKNSLKSVSETSAVQKRGRRERLKTRKNVQKPSRIYDKIVMKCAPITLDSPRGLTGKKRVVVCDLFSIAHQELRGTYSGC